MRVRARAFFAFSLTLKRDLYMNGILSRGFCVNQKRTQRSQVVCVWCLISSQQPEWFIRAAFLL